MMIMILHKFLAFISEAALYLTEMRDVNLDLPSLVFFPFKEMKREKDKNAL